MYLLSLMITDAERRMEVRQYMCYGSRYDKLYTRSEEPKKTEAPKEGKMNIPEPKEVEVEVPAAGASRSDGE